MLPDRKRIGMTVFGLGVLAETCRGNAQPGEAESELFGVSRLSGELDRTCVGRRRFAELSEPRTRKADHVEASRLRQGVLQPIGLRKYERASGKSLGLLVIAQIVLGPCKAG